MNRRALSVLSLTCLWAATATAAYPALDSLTENTAAQWGAGAAAAAAAVYDDAARVRIGSASIRFETNGGADTWLWTPLARAAGWDLSGIARLRFWVYAENPSPYGFQNASPWVRLGTGASASTNYFNYQTTSVVLNGALGTWLLVSVPLAGDSEWQRTTVGAPSLTDIDWLEIHADTWDYGFKLWIDGLEFLPTEGALPAPTNLQITPFYSTTYLQWNAVTAPNVAGYEVYRRPSSGTYGPPIKRVLRTSFNDYGLQPGQVYYYKVIAVDGSGAALSQFTTEQPIALDSSPARYTTHKNLETLIVFYKGGYTTSQVAQMVNGLKLGLEFYWRTTLCQMNMDVTWLYIDTVPPGADWSSPALLADLRAHGVQDNQFDLAYLVGQNLSGCLGGWVVLGSTCASLGTACGSAYPGRSSSINYTITWTYTHEIHHALETMQNISGSPEVLFCHFPWCYPSPLGPTGWHMDWGADFDGIAQTNRQYGNQWMELPPPYDGYIECVDDDHDGLPDADARLWRDEVRSGSSPAKADTDDDGLNDLREFTAGNFRGTVPTNPDTDGDGVLDGVDPHPLYRAGTTIEKFATPPTIDGTLEAAWPQLVDGYYFTMSSTSFPLKTYAGWDDNALYFAFETTRALRYKISLDGSGADGRFESPVRHVAGATDTYNQDNKGNHIGDSWGDGHHVYVAQDLSTVEVFGRSVITGAQVASSVSGSVYRIEVKIPRVLPGGAAYTWYPPDAPVVDGLTLTPGHVIGLGITTSELAGSDGSEFSGTWTSVFETHTYVDFTLHAAPVVCAGDANCDGSINWRDIDYLVAGMNDNLSAWTALFPTGPTCTFANVDASGDGQVNWRDIDPFIALMNTTCP
jgi:hypothetical protein